MILDIALIREPELWVSLPNIENHLRKKSGYLIDVSYKILQSLKSRFRFRLSRVMDSAYFFHCTVSQKEQRLGVVTWGSNHQVCEISLYENGKIIVKQGFRVLREKYKFIDVTADHFGVQGTIRRFSQICDLANILNAETREVTNINNDNARPFDHRWMGLCGSLLAGARHEGGGRKRSSYGGRTKGSLDIMIENSLWWGTERPLKHEVVNRRTKLDLRPCLFAMMTRKQPKRLNTILMDVSDTFAARENISDN